MRECWRRASKAGIISGGEQDHPWSDCCRRAMDPACREPISADWHRPEVTLPDAISRLVIHNDAAGWQIEGKAGCGAGTSLANAAAEAKVLEPSRSKRDAQ